ncbi:MAG: substrate-binding domain-containing protein [Nitrospira sp.]
MGRFGRRWVWMVVALCFDAGSVTAQEVLHVYGPGGPAPALREAAAEFSRTTGIQVEVTAGPTAKWLAKAKSEADLIYSGSESMMTDLIAAMEGAVDEAAAAPRYPDAEPTGGNHERSCPVSR